MYVVLCSSNQICIGPNFVWGLYNYVPNLARFYSFAIKLFHRFNYERIIWRRIRIRFAFYNCFKMNKNLYLLPACLSNTSFFSESLKIKSQIALNHMPCKALQKKLIEFLSAFISECCWNSNYIFILAIDSKNWKGIANLLTIYISFLIKWQSWNYALNLSNL